MNFANDIKTVEMAQSYISSVYLAEVKAVAFAVISSGYRSQALLYTHSDQRYIRRYGVHDPTQHYLCWVREDLYTAGDETTLQIFGSACTPRGVSILRIPLVVFCFCCASRIFCFACSRRCAHFLETSTASGSASRVWYVCWMSSGEAFRKDPGVPTSTIMCSHTIPLATSHRSSPNLDWCLGIRLLCQSIGLDDTTWTSPECSASLHGWTFHLVRLPMM